MARTLGNSGRIEFMRVVICGGGVIGVCTAYFLTLRQVEVIVVERTGVACAASGKSGGFLALDWCDGTALSRLARRSFNLHAELAAMRDGSRWGYRRLDTWSVLAGAGAVLAAVVPCPGPPGSVSARWCRAGSAHRRPRPRCTRRGSPRRCCRRQSA